jgi:DNA replication protein DnaC
VLLLDDWGMTAMDASTRADLLEIIDDRANTLANSQSPASYRSSIGTNG